MSNNIFTFDNEETINLLLDPDEYYHLDNPSKWLQLVTVSQLEVDHFDLRDMHSDVIDIVMTDYYMNYTSIDYITRVQSLLSCFGYSPYYNILSFIEEVKGRSSRLYDICVGARAGEYFFDNEDFLSTISSERTLKYAIASCLGCYEDSLINRVATNKDVSKYEGIINDLKSIVFDEKLSYLPEEYQWYAVMMNPENIRFIKNPSDDVQCIVAMHYNINECDEANIIPHLSEEYLKLYLRNYKRIIEQSCFDEDLSFLFKAIVFMDKMSNELAEFIVCALHEPIYRYIDLPEYITELGFLYSLERDENINLLSKKWQKVLISRNINSYSRIFNPNQELESFTATLFSDAITYIRNPSVETIEKVIELWGKEAVEDISFDIPQDKQDYILNKYPWFLSKIKNPLPDIRDESIKINGYGFNNVNGDNPSINCLFIHNRLA